jgi:hypothetical protein
MTLSSDATRTTIRLQLPADQLPRSAVDRTN